ncbi:MAG: hypothetical protein J07HB67_01755 [halophilic archaeon J07HB67]|nr:MAG: hypothetical protein J07HB67_01755 [halophilic archaeon J07HB67]
MAPTRVDSRRVRWLWGELSLVLQFVGICLTNYNPTPYETGRVRAVGGVCLFVGLVGFVTYVRRYGLPPPAPPER